MEGAQQISQMISSNISLTSLHLVDSGLDCETLLEVCKGVKESMSLEYLDLKHNIFDDKGLAGLIPALQENMSIKHLYLESMPISFNEAKRLANFFE